MHATSIDIEDPKRTEAALRWSEALLAGQKRVLEMVAKGDALPRILDALCRVVDEHSSDALSSFLLLDASGTRLRHGAAPRLPKSYIDAIDGVAIGPTGGSCITAAYRAAPVVVSDIAADPLWAAYRDLPLAHGLRACWSTPIISSEGKVLGTFATYYREPRSPSPQDLYVLEQVASVAAVSIKHKQSEESLRRSEAYLAEAQRLTHVGSSAFDLATGTIVYLSQEHFRIFGFDPEAGMPSYEVARQRIHPEDRDRILETFDRAVTERKDFEADHRIVLPDGTIKYVHVIAHPAFNASGDLVEYVGTVMDVTERKRAEEALQKAHADLTHVTRVATLGEMTASISHEINQPLGAMVNNANACLRWLAASKLEEVQRSATLVVADGHRAGEIIARIRALAQKAPTRKDWFEINKAVHEVIALARSEVQGNRVSLKTQLAGDLPPILGDRVQLQQVLLNLMMNAIEAMRGVDEGPRDLWVDSERLESTDVLIAVRDSGSGLDPQSLDRLFEAFYTTKPDGLGMGLAISRSIIEAHGGRLWATANAPRGAVFQFTLPTGGEGVS